ncbi:hypothetical protein J7E52_20975 [Bacillus sp. ISL-34]|uniref:hypothetical protein n=1 Tax=Bacillus sp. ISL-34 TaxID=2819121 RepID=UPI001BEA1144|nr:hypothetical protein [Bacillus sp. ISL-34]MBT2649149.1 hypothetical protein [Bacillus sp. ISL-34]
MFKKVCMSMMTLVMVGGVSASFANAETPEPQNDKIDEAREYILKSKEETINLLEDLQKVNPTLENVEKTIDKYYKKNPAPKEIIKDKDLSLEDVFPDQVEEIEGTLNLNEFMSEKEKEVTQNDEDSFIKFKHNKGEVGVYVGETGGVFILETKTIDENNNALSNSSKIGALASAQKVTKKERTTGIAYNAFGGKMFTLWAQGSFNYNGKSVSVATQDGDYNRHFWGSTLNITKPTLGKARKEVVGSQTYSEVYSRLYYEAVFGIKWAGVTMKSGTVETYVGGSKNGHLYGSAKRI